MLVCCIYREKTVFDISYKNGWRTSVPPWISLRVYWFACNICQRMRNSVRTSSATPSRFLCGWSVTVCLQKVLAPTGLNSCCPLYNHIQSIHNSLSEISLTPKRSTSSTFQGGNLIFRSLFDTLSILV